MGPWRSGGLQGWDRDNTRQAWNILWCQQGRKFSKSEGACQKETI